MGEVLERFKRKYEITTTADLVLIITVFSVAGSTVGFLVQYLLKGVFHPFHRVSPWIYVPIYISCALPTYQGLLLIYGFLLGQFNFFWKRFLKTRAALGRFFWRRKEALLALFSRQSRENV